jgi:hypothetical protein
MRTGTSRRIVVVVTAAVVSGPVFAIAACDMISASNAGSVVDPRTVRCAPVTP